MKRSALICVAVWAAIISTTVAFSPSLTIPHTTSSLLRNGGPAAMRRIPAVAALRMSVHEPQNKAAKLKTIISKVCSASPKES